MFGTYSIEERRKNKMKSDDRVIHLKPIEGLSTKNNHGITDNRLFTGGNRLHAVYNNQKGAWYCKYDQGVIPSGLDGTWTTFSDLLESVRGYFLKRNIEVTKVEE